MLVLAAGCGRLGFDVGGELDGGVDGSGAAVDAPPCSARFCDGFEDPALAAWTVLVDSGASADRDATVGFRGASLRATSPAGSSIATRYADVFPVVAAEQWVRSYILAPSGGTLDGEPVELTNPAGDHQVVFALYDDDIDIHTHGFSTSISALAGVAPARDTWTCFELHVVIGASGAIELYRDGSLLVSRSGVDTRPPGGDLSRLRVGLPSKPSAVAQQIFVDEVAADLARIGCL